MKAWATKRAADGKFYVSDAAKERGVNYGVAELFTHQKQNETPAQYQERIAPLRSKYDAPPPARRTQPKTVEVKPKFIVDKNGNQVDSPPRNVLLNPDLKNLPPEFQKTGFVTGIYNKATGESILGVTDPRVQTGAHRYLYEAAGKPWPESDTIGFGFKMSEQGELMIHPRNSFVAGQFNYKTNPEGYHDAFLLDPVLMPKLMKDVTNQHGLQLKPWNGDPAALKAWKADSFDGDPFLERVFQTASELSSKPPTPQKPTRVLKPGARWRP